MPEAWSWLSVVESFGNVVRLRNGHDRCVVVFSSFAFRPYAADAFSYRSYFEAHADKADLIFVKDPRNQWFNRGIEGLGQTVHEVEQSLGKILEEYGHVSMFGSSMGAYGALLFGGLLGVDHIFALSPQTFLAAPFPRYQPRIHTGTYAAIDPVALSRAKRTDVFAGEEDLFDVYQLMSLSSVPNVSTSLVPDAHHNVIGYWAEQNQRFLPMFAALCTPGGADVFDSWHEEFRNNSRLAELLEPEETKALIRAAVEAYFNERDIESSASLSALLRLVPDWLGATVFVGLLKLRRGALYDAIDAFEKVTTGSRTIDSHYDEYAKVLAMLKRPEDAIAVATRAVQQNTGKRGIFKKIADVFEAYEMTDVVEQCKRHIF